MFSFRASRVIRSLLGFCQELHAVLDVQFSSLGTSFEITVPDVPVAAVQTA